MLSAKDFTSSPQATILLATSSVSTSSEVAVPEVVASSQAEEK
jgi:hypothetical protein